MDKQEILEKSRKEYQGRDDFINDYTLQASLIGFFAAQFVAYQMGLMSEDAIGQRDPAGMVVVLFGLSIEVLYRGIRMKRWPDIIVGILLCVWTFFWFKGYQGFLAALV